MLVDHFNFEIFGNGCLLIDSYLMNRVGTILPAYEQPQWLIFFYDATLIHWSLFGHPKSMLDSFILKELKTEKLVSQRSWMI